MRNFVDASGRTWQVVTGRESWGSFVALFLPPDADGPIRQAPLRAVSQEDATRELEAMDTAGLTALLERGVPRSL